MHDYSFGNTLFQLRRRAGMTQKELAQRLNITARSVNRIIARLEEKGCVTIVGKRSTGKGRPARVMKFILPDSLPDVDGTPL